MQSSMSQFHLESQHLLSPALSVIIYEFQHPVIICEFQHPVIIEVLELDSQERRVQSMPLGRANCQFKGSKQCHVRERNAKCATILCSIKKADELAVIVINLLKSR